MSETTEQKEDSTIIKLDKISHLFNRKKSLKIKTITAAAIDYR